MLWSFLTIYIYIYWKHCPNVIVLIWWSSRLKTYLLNMSSHFFRWRSETLLFFLLIRVFQRCPWYNGYRRRKWIWRLVFKSCTRTIAFHTALIPLGKVWIQLFSLQLRVNCRTDWVLQPWWGNLSRREKTLNSNLLNSAQGLVNRIKVFHWSLIGNKSPQISRTLLSILAVLNNAVVWMVSTHPPTFKSSSSFNNLLVTVPKPPITIGIIITFIFHSFFNYLARSRYLSLFTFF